METRLSVQQVINSGYFLKPKSGDPQESSANVAGSAEEQNSLDQVTLSREGREQSSGNGSSAIKDAEKVQLDRQEIEQLQKLKFRDKEVRTHEQAHLSAAGQFARGGMSFTYQKGPDGVAYAVGGEVGIDLGKESTPEATLLKMQTVKRAALAPANPSGADRQIAAQAAGKEAQARQEILRETQEEVLKALSGDPPTGDDSTTPTDSVGSAAQATPSSSYASLKSAINAYKTIAES